MIQKEEKVDTAQQVSNPPIVEIKGIENLDETCLYRGQTYKTTDLFELSKGLDMFEVPLAFINLGSMPWSEIQDVEDVLKHTKRIIDADLSYPIIISPTGGILNGFHRVCKAILDGETSIKAVKLDKMPAPMEVLINTEE